MTVTSNALTVTGTLLLLHAYELPYLQTIGYPISPQSISLPIRTDSYQSVYSAYEHSVAVASLSTNLTPVSYHSPPIVSSEPNNDSSSSPSSFSSSNDADIDADSLHSATTASSSSSSATKTLPLDIIIETLFSVALLCAAVVLSAPSLQPIRWHVWAGQIERRGVERVMEGKASLAMAYRALEERPGFLDIRVRFFNFWFFFFSKQI